MYKEYAKPMKYTTLLIIVLITAALIFAGAINTLITYLNLPYRSLYQLLILALLSSVVYFLIKNILSEYEYCLTDNELIVKSKLGQNEQIRAQIDISSIDVIAFYTNPLLKQRKFTEKYTAKKSLLSENTYICIFSNNKLCALKFEPSDKLLDLLKEKGIQIEK